MKRVAVLISTCVSFAIGSVSSFAEAGDSLRQAEQLLGLSENYLLRFHQAVYPRDCAIQNERAQFKAAIQEASTALGQIPEPDSTDLIDRRNALVVQALTAVAISTAGINEEFPLLALREIKEWFSILPATSGNSTQRVIQISQNMIQFMHSRDVEHPSAGFWRGAEWEAEVQVAIQQARNELSAIVNLIESLAIDQPLTRIQFLTFFSNQYRDQLKVYRIEEPETTCLLGHIHRGKCHMRLSELVPQDPLDLALGH